MSATRLVGSLLGAFGGRALGRMVGGSTGAMVGSLAGSMLAGRGAAGGLGGLGQVLGSMMGGDDNDQAATAEATMSESEASVVLEAMCSAAKADGQVDQVEVDAIVSRLGDLDSNDEAMLRRELAAPLDLPGLIRKTPNGMEKEVYVASLLVLEVDTPEEVKYLEDLAAGLGISRSDVAEIHTAAGISG